MSYRLFIRPNPAGKDSFYFDWALYSYSGHQEAKGELGTYEEIEQFLHQNNIDNLLIVGLIPAQYVFNTHVSIPGKQSRVILQALPYVVEEQLAADIHQQHLALGERLSGGQFQVSVIQKVIFQTFFDLLSSFGGTLELVTSDASLLGTSSVDFIACFDDANVLFNSSRGNTLSLSVYDFNTYVESCLTKNDDEENRVLKLFLTSSEQSKHAILLAELQQLDQLDIQIETHQLTNGFDLLCESWYQNQTHGVNFCQGEFALEQPSDRWLEKWKSVAVVAGIWFVLQVGLNIGEGIYQQKQADYYASVALKSYQTLFPADKTATSANLERRLKGKLRTVSNKKHQLGFLELVGEAGFQYSKLSKHGDMRFQSLNYNAQRGDLVMELDVGSFDQLNQYKSGFVRSGLQAKIGSAVRQKNQIRGRLTISGS